jgi:hypothetical protein
VPLIHVRKLTQTCQRSPSQWEGTTADGLFIYVRFRWGRLTIGTGVTESEAIGNHNNVFEKQLGHNLDGTLEYEKLRDVTRAIIEWPEDFDLLLAPPVTIRLP